MTDLTIITDNKPRKLVAWCDLPAKEQEYFDYIDENDQFQPRFVKFKRQWHDAIDVQGITTRQERISMGWEMHVEPEHPFAKWHGIASDSFFSGMLFRYLDDGEQVIVGRYYS